MGFGLRYVSAEEAGGLLREGEVGLVPTETVVGLVAGEFGVSRLFEIKGRNPDKPIALLCGSAEEAFALASEVPPLARLLAERFWPHPRRELTLMPRLPPSLADQPRELRWASGRPLATVARSAKVARLGMAAGAAVGTSSLR